MKGVTLIELLIAVAILAILTTIAYPNYQDYISSAARTDFFVMANKILQAQERLFVENLTYTADLKELGYATVADVSSDEGYYLLTASACKKLTIDKCVLIVGVPQGTQAGEGDIGINSYGTKFNY